MPQTVETAEEFARGPDGKLTAVGQAQRWTMEFQTARERLKKWHEQGEKILDRYLDERSAEDNGESRLNLFTANVETQHAMLYGKVPGADVDRHFEDPNDDVARVAADMMKRLLKPLSGNDSFVVALSYALEDRLLPGFGFACARYEVDTEQAADESGEPILDDNGAPVEKKTSENVGTDHHYWKDVLWSPCRTFETSRWFGWSSPLTRDALTARFGDIGKLVPLNTKTGHKTDRDAVKADPWSRADVWEIWSKEDRTVYWYVEGFNQILDEKPDPLGLEGFYPFPKPMMAHATTRSYVPRPDFVLAQDLYNEIDTLSTRINLLEKAVRVAGAYDKSAPEVAKLLTDAGFNKLYPADNWASLAEKGGFKGVVDWFPLEQVTGAIAVLTEKRAEKIGLLQQVTGWSDIMRGQSNASETLGAQQLKAQYGSVRVGKFQAEFARFASDLQRIRAEIIAKHFDVQTIIDRSNVMQSELMDDPAQPGKKIPNMPLIQQAAQLLKDRFSAFRVEVKPENINLTDYAQLKQERTEVITALGGLFQATMPLIQMGGPPAAEFVLATASWLLAGTKGGDTLEAEFDQFRAKAQAAANAPKPPQPPDPKLQAAQVKAQAEAVKAKAGIVQTQVDAQAHMATTAMDLRMKQQQHMMEMHRIQAQQRLEAAKALATPGAPPSPADPQA